MQFLVFATDATDADAPARRVRARPAHMVLIQQLEDAGQFRLGGHTLDADERIIGSAIILDFPSRAEVDAYLQQEPYAVERVWEKITVTRVNLG